MISKKLLSEIVGKNIGRIEFNEDVDYYFLGTDTYCGSINIHELAHKCKEWAFDKYKTEIKSWKTIKTDEWGHRIKPTTICYVAQVFPMYTYADTEPEAIFKACEWIRTNK